MIFYFSSHGYSVFGTYNNIRFELPVLKTIASIQNNISAKLNRTPNSSVFGFRSHFNKQSKHWYQQQTGIIKYYLWKMHISMDTVLHQNNWTKK